MLVGTDLEAFCIVCAEQGDCVLGDKSKNLRRCKRGAKLESSEIAEIGEIVAYGQKVLRRLSAPLIEFFDCRRKALKIGLVEVFGVYRFRRALVGCSVGEFQLVLGKGQYGVAKLRN